MEIVSLAMASVALVASIVTWFVTERRHAARSKEEDFRFDRANAARVSAWVQHEFDLCDGKETPRANSLVIVNDTGVALTGIVVDVTMNGGDSRFVCDICPPGVFRAEWLGHPHSTSRFTWGLLTAAQPHSGGARPYSRTTAWCVRGMTFRDGMGQSWTKVDGTTLPAVA